MCILAGCDFLKALPGVGMKKAHGHVRKLKSYDKVRSPLGPSPALRSHLSTYAAAAARSSCQVLQEVN